MAQDRLKAISDCCDQMEVIRKATPGLPKNEQMICEIGELDMWEEIHRLLYDWSST